MKKQKKIKSQDCVHPLPNVEFKDDYSKERFVEIMGKFEGKSLMDILTTEQDYSIDELTCFITYLYQNALNLCQIVDIRRQKELENLEVN